MSSITIHIANETDIFELILLMRIYCDQIGREDEGEDVGVTLYNIIVICKTIKRYQEAFLEHLSKLINYLRLVGCDINISPTIVVIVKCHLTGFQRLLITVKFCMIIRILRTLLITCIENSLALECIIF